MVADGVMGLMLDFPEVRLCWLLAVRFTSKPANFLVCLLCQVGSKGKQKGLVQNPVLPKLKSLAAPRQALSHFTLQFW